MAADYSGPKQKIVADTVSICSQIKQLVEQAKALRQEAIDAGFTAGGVSPLVDGDLTAKTPSLLATDLTAAFTAITSIDSVLNATTFTVTGSGRVGWSAIVRLKEAL